MEISINNTSYSVKEKSSLVDLLNLLSLPEKGIAFAVNNKVVPKNDWQSFELCDNMRVTMIRATQGG